MAIVCNIDGLYHVFQVYALLSCTFYGTILLEDQLLYIKKINVTMHCVANSIVASCLRIPATYNQPDLRDLAEGMILGLPYIFDTRSYCHSIWQNSCLAIYNPISVVVFVRI